MLRQIIVIIVAALLMLTLGLYGPGALQREPDAAGVQVLSETPLPTPQAD